MAIENNFGVESKIETDLSDSASLPSRLDVSASVREARRGAEADADSGRAKRPRSFLRKKSRIRTSINQELADVYANGDGEIPNLTKLDRDDRPMWQIILYSLIAVLAVILALAIVGFLIFTNLNGETFTNERVAFKINPPISIVSGQEGIYNIIITNNEKVNLYNLNIQLFYPDNFQFIDSSPQPISDQKNIWQISILKVGETEKIELRGKLLAPLNSVSALKGLMTFKPANLNADFKQEVNLDLPITSSIIGLDLTGPDKALANENIEYIIKYKNLGEVDLNDLEIVAQYPAGFVIASSTPDSHEGGNNVWLVKKLASSTEGQIIISGNYSGASDSGNQEFKIQANLKIGGATLLQSEAAITTAVIKDQLTMNLIINGSAESQPISFGDLLTYTLNYKNTGQEELIKVELKAVLDSQILDWNTLLDDNHGRHQNNYLVWTGQEISQLLKLAPGEGGSISWQIRVKDLSALTNQAVSQFSVTSHSEAKIKTSLFNEQIVKSKTIENIINSDLGLIAGARYYNEDNLPLGLGPIQPKVGEMSIYNIVLNLNNNLHNLSNIEVAGVLPKNVVWSDRENQTFGAISYNSQTRRFSWQISALPKTAKNVSGQINLSITPTLDDLGSVLILLPQLSLTAKDSETGAIINKKIPAITTAFDDPILGQLSGIVE